MFTDLHPDSTGKGWPAGSGCQDQPLLAHQGFIVAENGFAELSKAKEQVLGPEGGVAYGAAQDVLLCMFSLVIIIPTKKHTS